MKRTGKIFLLLILLISFSAGSAFAYDIDDNYIGAAPTHSSYVGKDVIGEDALFGVDGMNVLVENGSMTVDIFSSYFDNLGKYDTELGDLFISTDGYTEYDQFYKANNPWEYVISLGDTHSDHLQLYGTASLYAVNPDNVDLSWAPDNYIYRANQAVQYGLLNNSLAGETELASGTWEITANDLLSINIGLNDAWWNGDDETTLGFHWAVTCANDVIEGAYTYTPPGGGDNPVPEPATMFLVGTGLVGLAGLQRKMRKKNS